MTLQITETSWPAHQLAITQLRREVFILEQQVPEALEWDDADASARHVCLWQNDQLLAYARLLTLTSDTGKLTRMAVKQSFRGQGLGRQLLQRVIARAQALGFKCLLLDAQLQAIGFYQRQGFTAFGELFWDAGIEHRSMQLALAAPDPACG